MTTCLPCKSNKSRKDRIDTFRLSEEEENEYNKTYLLHSKEDGYVYRNDFPKLLGILGTDISKKFALKIFDVFALNQKYITLEEYLKYADIYHHGNSQERCLTTFKLMDVNKNGKITLDYFKDYIELIVSAIGKVNPFVKQNLITENEIQMLFIKISQNNSFFTFEQFSDIFFNKPEIISWIDYFKNNENDISILIDKVIKTILKILLKFFNNVKVINNEFESIFDFNSQEKKSKLLEMLQKIEEEVNKYSKTIENLREGFIENSSFMGTRNVFNSIKSAFLNGVGNNYTNNKNDNNINFNNTKEINIKLSNNNKEKEDKNKKIDNTEKFEEKIQPNKLLMCIEDNKTNENLYTQENATTELFTEYDDAINEQKINSNKIIQDFYETHNSIDNINQSKFLVNKNINRDIANTNEDTNISNSDLFSMKLLKRKNKLKGIKNTNDDFSLTQYSFSLDKNSNKVMNEENTYNYFAKFFNNLTDTCIHALNWVNICYSWIQHKKLREFLKIEKDKNEYNIWQLQRKKEFDKNIDIPKNIFHSFNENNLNTKNLEKSSIYRNGNSYNSINNSLKTTDVNFKLLIKVIMGIQIACRNSNNINLPKDQLKLDDLSNFLKKNEYKIENFDNKKDENYFISEWAPEIFDNIRKLYGISKDSYVRSISPQEFITEMMISSTTKIEQLVSTGKSGSMFYYTKDGKFIIKTISKSEYDFLKTILPDYFLYIINNESTLVPKFYGCYELIIKKNNSNNKLYFVTINNLFSTNEIHLRYDLKGSTISRKVLPLNHEILEGEKYSISLKDLDFKDNTKFLYFGENKNLILDQISKDIKFLESKNIIDYSLLVGIQYSNDKIEKNNDNQEIKGANNLNKSFNHEINLKENLTSNKNLKNDILINIDEYINKSFINSSMNYFEEEFQSKYSQESTTQYYIQNKIKNSTAIGIKCGNTSSNGNEIYYVGIIDILTEFKSTKTIEYLFKSMLYCSQEMSCVPPNKYKKRFFEYISNIMK